MNLHEDFEGLVIWNIQDIPSKVKELYHDYERGIMLQPITK